SRKARLIEATGFFSLMVERVEPTVRYVAVDGAVSSIEPGTDAHLEEITRRYLSGDAADRYLEFARRELGAHVVITMKPENWLSSDMGSF
ncbi:MAG: pyridoxamine 5'-phosphate oxidase family protein, partial [Mycobacterium sp.]